MGGTGANTDTESYREVSSKTSLLVIAIVIAFIGLLLLARIFYVLRKNPKLSTHTLMRMLMAYFASLSVKTLFGIFLWDIVELFDNSHEDDDDIWIETMPYKTVFCIIGAAATLSGTIWLLIISYDMMVSVNSFKTIPRIFFVLAIMVPLIYMIAGLASIIPESLRDPYKNDELLVTYQIALFIINFIACALILGFVVNALRNLSYYNPQSKHAKSLAKKLNFIIYYPIIFISTELPLLIALCLAPKDGQKESFWYVLQACYVVVSLQGIFSASFFLYRFPSINKVRTKSGRIVSSPNKKNSNAAHSKESTLKHSLLEEIHQDYEEDIQNGSNYQSNFKNNLKGVFFGTSSTVFESSLESGGNSLSSGYLGDQPLALPIDTLSTVESIHAQL